MADAHISIGADLDIASGAELKSGLSALGSDIMGGMRKPRRILRPITKALSLSSGLLAAAPQVLSCGRPSTGRIWVLTRIVVLGADDHTTLTSVGAAMYIGDPSNPSIGQCVRPGLQVPYFSTENEHAYIIHDREDVFFNVYAAADIGTPVNLVANLQVWEYRDTDVDSQAV